jgi:hypothetical protein
MPSGPARGESHFQLRLLFFINILLFICVHIWMHIDHNLQLYIHTHTQDLYEPASAGLKLLLGTFGILELNSILIIIV